MTTRLAGHLSLVSRDNDPALGRTTPSLGMSHVPGADFESKSAGSVGVPSGTLSRVIHEGLDGPMSRKDAPPPTFAVQTAARLKPGSNRKPAAGCQLGAPAVRLPSRS